MSISAESQKTIDAYLAALRRQLRELLDEDARDIVEEIRAHILDKSSGDSPAESVAATLAALGSPEELARRYRTEEMLKRARMLRSPAFLMRSVLRWAALTAAGMVVFLVSAVGYCFGGLLFILGTLKLTNPHKTGVYGVFTAQNSSLSFQSGGPTGHDLLGWWLVPVGLILGGGLLFLTFRFDIWSIRRVERHRAWREV
jgi:Protein of unknown function (DUF1700)